MFLSQVTEYKEKDGPEHLSNYYELFPVQVKYGKMVYTEEELSRGTLQTWLDFGFSPQTRKKQAGTWDYWLTTVTTVHILGSTWDYLLWITEPLLPQMTEEGAEYMIFTFLFIQATLILKCSLPVMTLVPSTMA